MEHEYVGKRPDHNQIAEPIGSVIAISGSRATILLDSAPGTARPDLDDCPFIGTLLTVDTSAAVVLCLITSLKIPVHALAKAANGSRIAEVDLVGELRRENDGYLQTFQRGVSVYPRLGDVVQSPSRIILEKAYHFGKFNAITVGTIRQDPAIPAAVKVDEMLGKHFAVVGSTGTGKSCTVALALREVLEKYTNAHIVMLDPHNEYAACFGNSAELISPANLSLPFWILNFEEIVEIIIGNAQENPDEVDILRDLIPLAKQQFARAENGRPRTTLMRSGDRRNKYTVDVPLPYRMADLIALIDAQLGKLEMQNALRPYKKLRARVESIRQDPRFGFMFGALTVQDNLAQVLKRLFRIPVMGKPITVIQLMGIPSEVVNVVVSVLARLAFDLALWSDGKMPITVVCEEAHRYVPSDSSSGFEPTKRAISRIAKEGRKYGVSLCIVSQRPGDIDPAILSQCSTIFAMRLSNDRDQAIVRSALSDAQASLLEFLPSLGLRETIVFGEGVPLPSLILLDKLPEAALPKSNSADFAHMWRQDVSDGSFVDDAIARWRAGGQNTEEQPVAADNGQSPPRVEQDPAMARLSAAIRGSAPTQRPTAGALRPPQNGTGR